MRKQAQEIKLKIKIAIRNSAAILLRPTENSRRKWRFDRWEGRRWERCALCNHLLPWFRRPEMHRHFLSLATQPNPLLPPVTRVQIHRTTPSPAAVSPLSPGRSLMDPPWSISGDDALFLLRKCWDMMKIVWIPFRYVVVRLIVKGLRLNKLVFWFHAFWFLVALSEVVWISWYEENLGYEKCLFREITDNVFAF